MFLDIFNEDGLPRDIFNVEFVKKLRMQLRPNGVLVANIFCNIKLFNQILQMFESSFKTVHLLAVEENRNNIIMVAYNADAVPAEKLLETGSNIAEHHRLDFDLEHVLRFALSEGSYGHAQED
ncbi:spermidine synthase [compost metagenome]